MKKSASKKKSGSRASKKPLLRNPHDLDAAEQTRQIAILDRAVAASVFLPIHSFLTERQAQSLVDRIKKRIIKYRFLLVDKSFKEYKVLPANAKLGRKWRVIMCPEDWVRGKRRGTR